MLIIVFLQSVLKIRRIFAHHILQISDLLVALPVAFITPKIATRYPMCSIRGSIPASLSMHYKQVIFEGSGLKSDQKGDVDLITYSLVFSSLCS